MTVETVAVTGGNGRIGSAILAECVAHGYETVNVARGDRREEVSDRYVETDLLDPEAVTDALQTADPDAVIHMATIGSPEGVSRRAVYESNVMTSFHVLDAATDLDVDRVCLPSSINALGAAYQAAPTDVRYLPVDEDHPRTPRDPYAMGKHAMEVTADAFGRMPDGPSSIASLRFPWTAGTELIREKLAEPDRSLGSGSLDSGPGDRDELFSYLHVADAGAVARRAIEVDLGGHEIFWTVANDTTVDAPSAEVVEEYYPDVEVRRQIGDTDPLIAIEKAEQLLGWEPERSWRDV
jgi:nucleoside-diphosphate-sugar epimerase